MASLSRPIEPVIPSIRPSYKWWALTSTSLGMMMAVLNMTTLIIALPTLIRVLHMSPLLGIWVMLGYMVVQTVLILGVGRFSDIVGRKPLYVAGFGLFTIAALVAGFAPNGVALLIIRAVQAIGGALILGNASTIVTDAFPREQLGLALGISSIVIAVGQVAGPIIGGVLITLFNWRWVFWFNVPIGVFGTIWAWVQLRDLAPPTREKTLDYVGNVTYMVALVSVLFALTWGGVQGWNNLVVLIGLTLGVVGFLYFFRIESRVPSPLLNLKLFENRVFAMGNLANLFIAIGRGAIVLLFVFYFQGGRGYNALQAGIAVVPLAMAMGVAAPISGWLGDRIGARIPSTVGAALVGVGLIGQTLTLTWTASYAVIAFWMMVVGIGNGLFNSPNTSSIMGIVKPQQRGIAAGTRTMLLNTGNVFSMAFVLALVASTLPSSVMVAIFAGEPASVSPAGLAVFLQGLHLAFFIMAGISLFAALLSALRGQEGSSEEAPSPVMSVRSIMAARH